MQNQQAAAAGPSRHTGQVDHYQDEVIVPGSLRQRANEVHAYVLPDSTGNRQRLELACRPPSDRFVALTHYTTPHLVINVIPHVRPVQVSGHQAVGPVHTYMTGIWAAVQFNENASL